MSRRHLLAFVGGLAIDRGGGDPLLGRELWSSAWEAYRDAFIDGQGRVIDYSSNEGFTTSEGQAYALFFSLIANDRNWFRRLLAWTNANLAEGNLGHALPAWKWGRGPRSAWKIIGDNSAADADAWLAYTLLQAGRVWSDHNLGATGNTLAARIVADESVSLGGVGRVLLPSSAHFPRTPPILVNPSYTPLFLAQGIAEATGQPGWRAIAAAQSQLISAVAPHGFAPDWAWLPSRPPAPSPGLPQAGTGSFDAIRVYLWAGLTAADAPGAATELSHLGGMAHFLASNATPPLSVDIAAGTTQSAGPVGFSGALLPYLSRLKARKALSRQIARVLAHREVSGRFGKPADYYSENLILFGLGGLTGVMSFDKSGAVLAT